MKSFKLLLPSAKKRSGARISFIALHQRVHLFLRMHQLLKDIRRSLDCRQTARGLIECPRPDPGAGAGLGRLFERGDHLLYQRLQRGTVMGLRAHDLPGDHAYGRRQRAADIAALHAGAESGDQPHVRFAQAQLPLLIGRVEDAFCAVVSIHIIFGSFFLQRGHRIRVHVYLLVLNIPLDIVSCQ